MDSCIRLFQHKNTVLTYLLVAIGSGKGLNAFIMIKEHPELRLRNVTYPFKEVKKAFNSNTLISSNFPFYFSWCQRVQLHCCLWVWWQDMVFLFMKFHQPDLSTLYILIFLLKYLHLLGRRRVDLYWFVYFWIKKCPFLI